LRKLPNERLGSGPEDVLEIKRQAFFDQIDWEKLEARKITPPWKPNVDDPNSVVAIDPEFITRPVPQSLHEQCIGSGTNKDPSFVNFTYISDTVLNN
jgi:hypothetical protein